MEQIDTSNAYDKRRLQFYRLKQTLTETLPEDQSFGAEDYDFTNTDEDGP